MRVWRAAGGTQDEAGEHDPGNAHAAVAGDREEELRQAVPVAVAAAALLRATRDAQKNVGNGCVANHAMIYRFFSGNKVTFTLTSHCRMKYRLALWSGRFQTRRSAAGPGATTVLGPLP